MNSCKICKLPLDFGPEIDRCFGHTLPAQAHSRDCLCAACNKPRTIDIKFLNPAVPVDGHWVGWSSHQWEHLSQHPPAPKMFRMEMSPTAGYCNPTLGYMLHGADNTYAVCSSAQLKAAWDAWRLQQPQVQPSPVANASAWAAWGPGYPGNIAVEARDSARAYTFGDASAVCTFADSDNQLRDGIGTLPTGWTYVLFSTAGYDICTREDVYNAYVQWKSRR